MNNKKNIIFIGTPDFSVPTLKALIADERYYIFAVITAPDAPVGRKQILTPPPVKVVAEKHNITVLQPQDINEITSKIAELNPDAIITIAYGQIIPKAILDIPKSGCLNLHASLLPKYRGASPIQAAILNGDKTTGVTLMKMDKTIDTGPIIAQESLNITPNETGESLHDKLAELSAEILIKYLPQYLDGKLTPKPQDNSRATLTQKITRESGRINWQRPAEEIERMVRAYYPWPGTYTKWDGRILKIISASPTTKGGVKPPRPTGTVFLHNNQLAVQCGSNTLIIKKLQLEGKKQMTSNEFLAGHQDILEKILK